MTTTTMTATTKAKNDSDYDDDHIGNEYEEDDDADDNDDDEDDVDDDNDDTAQGFSSVNPLSHAETTGHTHTNTLKKVLTLSLIPARVISESVVTREKLPSGYTIRF